MIAVVTGSSGFIGSNLVDHLIAGGWKVRVLRQATSRVSRADVETHLVSWDQPHTPSIVSALANADAVFHLAGVTKAANASAFESGNVTPTEVLLNAMGAMSTPARFVLVSSQAAAGPARSLDRPVVESDEPQPVEAYGESKARAEHVARNASASIPITIVRPSAVYGPRDGDFLHLFRLAVRGFGVFPATRGHWIDIVHVDDVVRGLIAAGTSPHAVGQTFFLGGRAVTWDVVHDEIGRAVGRSVRSVALPAWAVRGAAMAGDVWTRVSGQASLVSSHKVTLGLQRYWVCSSERARARLGYEPRCPLPEGMRQTYLWYRTQGWL